MISSKEGFILLKFNPGEKHGIDCEGLENVMAARDPYTVNHQQRVAQLSSAIAQEMGLEEKQIHNLTMAARLHDFGKISFPLASYQGRENCQSPKWP